MSTSSSSQVELDGTHRSCHQLIAFYNQLNANGSHHLTRKLEQLNTDRMTVADYSQLEESGGEAIANNNNSNGNSDESVDVIETARGGGLPAKPSIAMQTSTPMSNRMGAGGGQRLLLTNDTTPLLSSVGLGSTYDNESRFVNSADIYVIDKIDDDDDEQHTSHECSFAWIYNTKEQQLDTSHRQRIRSKSF